MSIRFAIHASVFLPMQQLSLQHAHTPCPVDEVLWGCTCRPEEFGGRKYLLKSIHYAATHRGDMFTLPCDPKVSTTESRSLPWYLKGGPEVWSLAACASTSVNASARCVWLTGYCLPT